MRTLVRRFSSLGAAALALSFAWNASAVDFIGLGLDRGQLPGQTDDDDDDDEGGANEFTVTLQLPVMQTDNADRSNDDRRSSLLFSPSLGLKWEHAIGATPLSLSIEFSAQSSRYRKASSADAGEITGGARLQYDVGRGRDDQRPVFYISAERT